jgi:hypothetical protein
MIIALTKTKDYNEEDMDTALPKDFASQAILLKKVLDLISKMSAVILSTRFIDDPVVSFEG